MQGLNLGQNKQFGSGASSVGQQSNKNIFVGGANLGQANPFAGMGGSMPMGSAQQNNNIFLSNAQVAQGSAQPTNMFNKPPGAQPANNFGMSFGNPPANAASNSSG